MSDLREEEMQTWESLIVPGADNCGRAHEMLLEAFAEIRRHRAARRADAELVRQVVREALQRAVTRGARAIWGDNETLDDIATRVAEQLASAAPVLSADERALVVGMLEREGDTLSAIGHLGEDVRNNISRRIAFLSRLLGASR